MGHPLNKITIKGFKSIKSLEGFELKKLNILIGGNGVGKSNFIQFFRMISAMMKPDGLKEFAAGNSDAYFCGGVKETKVITIKMRFGQNGYDFSLAPTENGFFLINNEQRHYFGYGYKTRNFSSGNLNPQILNEIKSSEATSYTYDAISSWQIYHFHDTTLTAGMRKFSNCEYDEKLFADASNIAPFLYSLHENNINTYNRIIDTIRLVTPFFHDFILKPNKNDTIRLQWQQKGMNDYPMRPSQLSDGTIRFICLVTALLQPTPPSTIIIDEPELGLHPYAVDILAELLQAASKRMQVIVSTQSPVLVDSFKPEEVIVINRENGASVFRRLNTSDLKEWLNDYSLGELWRKNIVAGGPVHK